MRALFVSLGLGLSLNAPMQCQSEPPPEQRRYERPPEALYELAQRFEKQGDASAWRTTLETIIERYPNSREAVMAKDDLETHGQPALEEAEPARPEQPGEGPNPSESGEPSQP